MPVGWSGAFDDLCKESWVGCFGRRFAFMPLYAGGYISSLVDQAKSNLKKAKSDLEDKSNKIGIM